MVHVGWGWAYIPVSPPPPFFHEWVEGHTIINSQGREPGNEAERDFMYVNYRAATTLVRKTKSISVMMIYSTVQPSTSASLFYPPDSRKLTSFLSPCLPAGLHRGSAAEALRADGKAEEPAEGPGGVCTQCGGGAGGGGGGEGRPGRETAADHRGAATKV